MSGVRRFAAIGVLAMIAVTMGVTAAHAGGGGHCEPSEGDAGVVELSGACFLPSTLHADTGETITFVNRDPVPHNVTGTGWGQYEDLAQGERFTTSFADPGIYPFACTLHPGMNGVARRRPDGRQRDDRGGAVDHTDDERAGWERLGRRRGDRTPARIGRGSRRDERAASSDGSAEQRRSSQTGSGRPACCIASSKSWRFDTAWNASSTETVPVCTRCSRDWSNVIMP